MQMEVSFRNILKNRDLRRIYPVQDLAALIKHIDYGDEVLRNQIASELIMRGWLYSASPGDGPWGLQEAFSQGLGELMTATQVGVIYEWCCSQAVRRTFEVPVEWQGFAESLRNDVSYELDYWKTADGFVLFVTSKLVVGETGHIGDVLPFYLKEDSAHACLFRDSDDCRIEGNNCEDIHKSIKAANDHWSRQVPGSGIYAIRMLTLSSVGECKVRNDLPLEGESAGLAVILALARRALIKPGQSVFEMGASGVLGANGSLLPNGHGRESMLAKERLLQWMGVKRRMLPAGVNYTWPDKVISPEGNVGAFLCSAIKDWNVSCDAPFSILKAEQELDAIQYGMRFGRRSASEAKIKCEEILSKTDGDTTRRGLELRTSAKMALAAAECHSANPERSVALCDEVIRDARTGLRTKVMAMVRQVVNLTDLCRYAAADDFARNARELLSKSSGWLSPVEQFDLDLQISGSLGQALCYWGLIDSSHRECALVELQRAADIARELDGGCDDGEQRDFPRNQCYLYLAHALNYPESAERVYSEVESVCVSHEKTKQYLLRTRWLSAYRMALVEHALPEGVARLNMALPMSDAERGWLHRTTLKYRGTLRALQGDISGALTDFQEASRMIDEPMPLFKFIGATICLQAGESLMPHNPAVAANFLVKAVAQFDEYKDWFVKPVSGQEWLSRAKGILAGRQYSKLPNPQMCYPY